jgi:hypothetical protein
MKDLGVKYALFWLFHSTFSHHILLFNLSVFIGVWGIFVLEIGLKIEKFSTIVVLSGEKWRN